MQYWQRRLHRSVTEMRTFLSGRPNVSRTGTGALPLADESALLHAHVEMVPRQALVQAAGARRVELGVAVPFAQRAAPVAAETRGSLDEVADAPVTAGEQRLERGFARIFVQHAHVRE